MENLKLYFNILFTWASKTHLTKVSSVNGAGTKIAFTARLHLRHLHTVLCFLVLTGHVKWQQKVGKTAIRALLVQLREGCTNMYNRKN